MGNLCYSMEHQTTNGKYINEIVGECQSGFRKGKSILDHIFTLRQIMAKFYKFYKERHIIFIECLITPTLLNQPLEN